MFEDEESVFDRLWQQISERFGFIAPVWIINRTETLTVIDYRPTFLMFLTATGFVLLTIAFFLLLFWYTTTDSLALWATGIPAIACAVFLFRGTIRESYYFDKTTDKYAFVRRFIHRKEVIEGALSQFTGAYVKTETNDESKSYFVVLKQEGMFLTGVDEQPLREEVPIFNSFGNEARIANAIAQFLSSKQQN
jgi:hypothetical protein